MGLWQVQDRTMVYNYLVSMHHCCYHMEIDDPDLLTCQKLHVLVEKNLGLIAYTHPLNQKQALPNGQ